MARGAAVPLIVSLAALAAAVASCCLACTEDRPACYVGEYVACSCVNGALGYAGCDPQIAGYGPCVCDGSTPGLDASTGVTVDASTNGDASASDASDAGRRPLFEACAANGDCESGVCFAYGDGRSLCTKACSSPADCAAPSQGCNGLGVCRFP
jgi:hypothetical protein